MPTKFYEFYDKPVKMRLENNDILMYSTHNEGEKGWKVKEKYWRVKFIKKKKLMMIVWYYHVTYAFQSESALYSFLNIKELLAQNRCDIWSFSDNNGIRTNNHLVCKKLSTIYPN